MAIIKAVNSKAGIGHAINYITKADKTDIKLMGGFNCNPLTALEEMKATKKAWHKTDGRQYKHFIQSFSPQEDITLEEANKIARELIESSRLFVGYEVCYATHKDREHIHTHFIVNSVSFEDGHKFNYSNNQLQQFKNLSDEILQKYNKTICHKNSKVTNFKLKKYKTLEKASKGEYKSWVLDIENSVTDVMKSAQDKEEFIEMLNKQGFDVSWEDNKKYITFTDNQGHKIRDKKLSETFKRDINKEELQNEFERNRKYATGYTRNIGTVKRQSEYGSDSQGECESEGEVICVERGFGRNI